jgi:site-specific recombinase XerD
MLIGQAIGAFSSYLLVERNLSTQTDYAYRHDLMSLCRELGDVELSTITTEDLHRWLAEQKQRGLAPLSMNRRIACLRSFFKFTQARGYSATNPASLLSLPKKPRRIPRPLNEQEMRWFLTTPVRKYSKKTMVPLHLRDRIAFDLMLILGLRRGELLNLKLEDVELGLKTLRVRQGKGGQDRILPLPHELADRLHDYMIRVLPLRSPYLIVSQNGGRMYSTALQRAFKRHLRVCGITREGVTLHSLRHTMATSVLRGSGNIHAVQRLLGHRDITSTTAYLHLDDGDLRVALNSHAALQTRQSG